MRREAWELAGGFPGKAQEDLAFSFVLAAKGMRGVFLEDVVCGEDLPPTFRSVRRQHERYVAGSAWLCLSFMIPAWRGLLSYAITGRVDAPPTHGRGSVPAQRS